MRRPAALLILLAWGLLLPPGSVYSDELVHVPPTHLVWESRGVLSTAARREIEARLLEHQHLTGQRLLLAILPEGPNPFPPEWAKSSTQEIAEKLFDYWGLEISSRAANALLLVHERSPGKPKVGLQIGGGIPLEGEAPEPDPLEDALEDLQNWDAIGTKALKEGLALLQSPILLRVDLEAASTPSGARVTDTRKSLPPSSPPSSKPSTWLWVMMALISGGSFFYWISIQIVDQEVLIGTRRWVLFGPRLRLRLWTKTIPPDLILCPRPADLGEPKIYQRSRHGRE
jgi:hypothetical protein